MEGRIIFQRYAMRDLVATSSLAENGSETISSVAPPDFCARIVNIDEIMLRTINGSFPINAVLNVLKDVSLLKGYQSKISNTSGRLTAMGLLKRARMKKARVKKYDI